MATPFWVGWGGLYRFFVCVFFFLGIEEAINTIKKNEVSFE